MGSVVPRTLRRVVAVAAVLAVSAVGLSTPTSADNGGFTDVPPGAYYAEAVDWLVAENITNGVAPGLFAPDDVVTRDQMAAFLWRFMGSPAPLASPDFTDVPPGVYFTDAVAWLAENGITQGIGNGLYGPAQVVSRSQMAAFLWRLAGSPTPHVAATSS